MRRVTNRQNSRIKKAAIKRRRNRNQACINWFMNRLVIIFFTLFSTRFYARAVFVNSFSSVFRHFFGLSLSYLRLFCGNLSDINCLNYNRKIFNRFLRGKEGPKSKEIWQVLCEMFDIHLISSKKQRNKQNVLKTWDLFLSLKN